MAKRFLAAVQTSEGFQVIYALILAEEEYQALKASLRQADAAAPEPTQYEEQLFQVDPEIKQGLTDGKLAELAKSTTRRSELSGPGTRQPFTVSLDTRHFWGIHT